MHIKKKEPVVYQFDFPKEKLHLSEDCPQKIKLTFYFLFLVFLKPLVCLDLACGIKLENGNHLPAMNRFVEQHQIWEFQKCLHVFHINSHWELK